MVKILGHGSYGEVALATDTSASHSQTSKNVAIKRISNVFSQEIDAKRIYREIFILRNLKQQCVINLLDVLRGSSGSSEDKTADDSETLYLIFEFVDTDLYKLIMSPQYLSIDHIKYFMYQMLQGLNYVHSANVIHRDLKPANILLNEDCSLKICDFGLARVVSDADMGVKDDTSDASSTTKKEMSDKTPDTDLPRPKSLTRQLTRHVVTRWYRAPELILLQEYTSAVDVWSLGCIFAELLSMQEELQPRYQDRQPLFPGKTCFPLSSDAATTVSDKMDQLNVIFNVIGTPSDEDIDSIKSVRSYLQKLPKRKNR